MCRRSDCLVARYCPGLIDVHAHLTFGTAGRSYEDVMREDSDDLMLIRGVRNCQLHLAAGVTTVRDCGARNRTTHCATPRSLDYFQVHGCW